MRDLNILISGLVGKDNNKRICVYFSDGDNYAEGTIPECKIKSSKGFSEAEILEIEEYLRANKDSFIEEAKKVNPMRAFLGKS